MGVGRRGGTAAVLTGLVLLAGPAAAQEAPADPCAVPPAVAGEPAPTPDPMCQSGTPVDEAAAPVPSGAAVPPDTPVSSEPGTGPSDDPCAVPSAVPGEPAPTPPPMCQSGTPVVDAGGGAGSGGGTSAPAEALPDELPFTGPDDRALLLGSLGAGLLLAGTGLVVAGRRRA